MNPPTIQLMHGDCLSLLPSIPSASVDAVISDPPYPEIDRDYGRWTEAEWHELMRGVVRNIIGIERHDGYFAKMQRRIAAAKPNSGNLFADVSLASVYEEGTEFNAA